MLKPNPRHRTVPLFSLIAALALHATCASAAGFVVTVSDDSSNGADGLLSLREAITAANAAGAGPHTITFDGTVFAAPGPHTIQLDSVLPDLNCNLTITSPGANVLTVRGEGSNDPYRMLTIAATSTVNISGLTISNGYFQGPAGTDPSTPGQIGQGGGIFNSGTLTLTECVLSGNTLLGGPGYSGGHNQAQNGSAGADGFGGAIFSNGTALTIVRCTFSGNFCYGGAGGGGSNGDSYGQTGNGAAAASGWGGALYVSAGACTISNTTFSGNTVYGGFGGSGGAPPSGAIRAGGNGGNADGGAIYTLVPITITSCTVSGGSANAGNGGYHLSGNFDVNAPAGTARGGGLNASGTITIGNSLVSGNTSLNPVTSVSTVSDVFGTFVSQNFNLVGGLDGTATGFNGTADQTGTLVSPIDAKLDPLGATANGGTVTTVRLRKGSPAVDKGKNLTSGIDQRGLTRPVDLSDATYPNATDGDGSDIGAFESQTLPNDLPQVNNQSFNGTQDVSFPASQLTGFDQDGDTLTFSLTTGTMPTGLTLNSDGTITGTPTTPGQFTVKFVANDGLADSVERNLTLNIAETQSLTVTTITDVQSQFDGLTSLREAVNFASSSSGTVLFDATVFATAKTIALTNGTLSPGSITINGPAAGLTITSTSGVFQVFAFSDPGPVVNLKDLTIASSGTSAISAFNFGGTPTFNLTNCTLRDNASDDGKGGAINNSSGTITLTNCTLSGNHANDTGTTNGGGGAIYQSNGSITILNCTIANNTSTGATSNGGGGILVDAGTVTIGNSIIANNTADSGPDIKGTVASQGFNLIGNNANATITGTTASNQVNVSAGLDAGGLASNGGPTQTIALAAGSNAIDKGNALGGVTTDQRGTTRPTDDAAIANASGGDGSDIGAFEKLTGETISIVADQASLAEGSGSGNTAFTFTVSRTGPTTGAATANFAVTGSGGNPANAADFGGTLPSGTVTILDTQASATITVNVSKDGSVEANEQFTVTLSTPSGSYSIGTAAVSSTITNDDKSSATTVAASSVTATTATLNGLVNDNGASTTVSFDYGDSIAFGTNVAGTPSPVTGATDTAVSAAITGLTPNTTYFFRVNGVNSGGTTNATELQFTTLPLAPVATTVAASVITPTSATLNGTVNASGASTAVSFDYGDSIAFGTNVAGTPTPVTGSTNTSVSVAITGLTPNTTYFFRVNGVNAGGTTNATELQFTTPPLAPVATSAEASVITTTTATLNGIINAKGASTAVSFDYGDSIAFGTNVAGTPSPVTGSVDTPVSADITGLTPNTTYFFRVNGVNSGGTTNAVEFSFTTLPLPPVATTAAATDITAFTATLNGTVDGNGGSTAVTFEYGTTASYGTTVAGTPTPVTGSTAVSAAVTGLLPNTTYHFRVNGISAGGTANGADLTFTTGASTLAIDSGPTATPTVAGVGQTVTFNVSASDSGGNAPIYTWDIAGTAATGASPTMVFTAPGVYTATVTVTTAVGGSVAGSVQVTVVSPAVGEGSDTDGDGFSDEFEIAAGTSPINAADSPTGGAAPTTAALTQSKLSIKLNFAKADLDSISFKGTLPVPAGYNSASKTITVDVGGVVKAITLDLKGKSKELKLAIKSKRGVVAAQTASFGVKLIKGNFDAFLTDEGLINADVTAANANVVIRVIFNGVIYQSTQAVNYSAKAGKTGKTKLPK